MIKYTINDKEYTELDINCYIAAKVYDYPEDRDIARLIKSGKIDFCNDPRSTLPIIEKIWDDLMDTVTEFNDVNIPRWEYLVLEHKCSKLIAACICFIELNQGDNK